MLTYHCCYEQQINVDSGTKRYFLGGQGHYLATFTARQGGTCGIGLGFCLGWCLATNQQLRITIGGNLRSFVGLFERSNCDCSFDYLRHRFLLQWYDSTDLSTDQPHS